jgi:hypothetical protein
MMNDDDPKLAQDTHGYWPNCCRGLSKEVQGLRLPGCMLAGVHVLGHRALSDKEGVG